METMTYYTINTVRSKHKSANHNTSSRESGGDVTER